MPPTIQWIVTTQTAPWQVRTGLTMQPVTSMPGVFVRTDMPQQTIQGFGDLLQRIGFGMRSTTFVLPIVPASCTNCLPQARAPISLSVVCP
jgi:hypothetical protein